MYELDRDGGTVDCSDSLSPQHSSEGVGVFSLLIVLFAIGVSDPPRWM